MATVSVLGMVSTLAIIAVAAFRLEAFNLEQQRLESVTQTIAMSVSDVSRGFRTGFPCDVAKEIAHLNMVKVVECRIVGFDTFIRARTKSVGMVLFASARAG
mgnify:FL=1